MDSQQPFKRHPSLNWITVESGDALLQNGRAGIMLDYIITESMNPVMQKDQPLAWQAALLSLANVVPYFLQPRASVVMDKVKRCFPAAIAAYEHPLACLTKRGSLRYALLLIFSVLAEMARSDKALYNALDHHGIPCIALLTWLPGPDPASQVANERSAEAAAACLEILDIFQDYKKFIPAATKRLGTQSVAKQLLAAFLPRMEYAHFGDTCLLASWIVEFSGLGMAHETLRRRVPNRVLTLFWEVLACEPKETDIRRKAIGPALGLITNIMANHFRLGEDASTAFFVEMVQSCDLASLCTLASYRSATMKDRTREMLVYDEAQLQEATKGIIRACAKRPDLVSTHISPCFLPALDHLRDLGEQAIGHFNEVLNIWISLTEVSSLEGSEEKVASASETISETNRGGCSWYQCIFHWGEAQGAVAKPMFLDNSCKRVRYCSRYCQKRDWNDGGHKGQCTLRNGLDVTGPRTSS